MLPDFPLRPGNGGEWERLNHLWGKSHMTMRDLRHLFPGIFRKSALRGLAERSWKDPLYRNSLTLALNRLFNGAVIGFLFWSISAHEYPVAAVGIGTSGENPHRSHEHDGNDRDGKDGWNTDSGIHVSPGKALLRPLNDESSIPLLE